MLSCSLKMCNVLTVIVISLLFLSFSPKSSHSYSIDYFSTYPTNPKAGDYVSMECGSYIAPWYGYDLIWNKDGQDLTRNGEFLDEEFGNRTDTSLRYYVDFVTLQLASVSRSDGGNYTCSLYDGVYLLDEQTVTLNVLYYPSSDFPDCSVRSDTTDVNSILSCISEIGNPDVSLDWTLESGGILDEDFKPVVNLTAEWVTYEITIKNTEISSDDVYTCSALSSEFAYTRNCTIHAEAIRFTNVIPRKLHLELPDKAEFNCLTNVEPTQHLWVTEPEIPQSRKSIAGSAFRINPVLAEDNGTSVSCYALFVDHWLQAEAELWVSLNSSQLRIQNNIGRNSSQLGIRNNTIAHNETFLPENTNAKGGDGKKSSAWISAFVVMTIAFAVAIGFIVYLYRNNQNGERRTSKSAQAIVSVQPKANQNIKGKAEEEDYMELNHNGQKSQEYSGLGLGANRDRTQGSIRYVNNAFEKGSTQIGGDEELYDYPETKESEQYEDVKV